MQAASANYMASTDLSQVLLFLLSITGTESKIRKLRTESGNFVTQLSSECQKIHKQNEYIEQASILLLLESDRLKTGRHHNQTADDEEGFIRFSSNFLYLLLKLLTKR